MGRLPRVREAQTKSKELNPIWRGCGCIMLVVVTLGSYFVVDAALGALKGRPNLPTVVQQAVANPVLWENKEVPFNRPVLGISKIPGGFVRIRTVSLAGMVLLSLLFYSLTVLGWAALNPPKLGPRDAPQPRPRKGGGSSVR